MVSDFLNSIEWHPSIMNHTFWFHQCSGIWEDSQDADPKGEENWRLGNSRRENETTPGTITDQAQGGGGKEIEAGGNTIYSSIE